MNTFSSKLGFCISDYPEVRIISYSRDFELFLLPLREKVRMRGDQEGTPHLCASPSRERRINRAENFDLPKEILQGPMICQSN